MTEAGSYVRYGSSLSMSLSSFEQERSAHPKPEGEGVCASTRLEKQNKQTNKSCCGAILTVPHVVFLVPPM